MRIGIDVRLWGTQHAGIGRYTEELVRNLHKVDKENSYILFCRKKDLKDIPVKKEWRKVVVDVPHYTLREQVVLPFIFSRQKLDLLHVPHFNVPVVYSRAFVVTIHDVLWHEVKGPTVTTLPAPLYATKYFGYKVVVANALYKAEKIIAPSVTVKEDLLKRFRLPDEKVVVTHEGFSVKKPLGEKKSIEILEKHKIKAPYLLYVGNLYPHKNVGAVVAALKLMNNPPRLVVVCGRSVFWKRFKKFVERENAEGFVKLVGYVSDEELAALYKNAEAFVFPTLSEGFGLPGLEAMAYGTPVVCSDIPVLREVYGDAALYFNPKDANEIANAVMRVYASGKLRSELVARGKEQVKRYSWLKMAEETLRVYENLLKE